MKEETRNLMMDIINCPDFVNDDSKNCVEIKYAQQPLQYKQIPEPWNGNIETAPIMFISSNPSIDYGYKNKKRPATYKNNYGKHRKGEPKLNRDQKQIYENVTERIEFRNRTIKVNQIDPEKQISEVEIYPNVNMVSQNEESVRTFFENRFFIANENHNKLCLTRNEKQTAYKNVPFWDYLDKWTNEILTCLGYNEANPDISPFYYVSTEVVHCKSRDEIGVPECKGHCFEKWFEKILETFNGALIVVVGSKARDVFFNKKSGSIKKELKDILDMKKINLITIPHSNAWGANEDGIYEKIIKTQLDPTSTENIVKNFKINHKTEAEISQLKTKMKECISRLPKERPDHDKLLGELKPLIDKFEFPVIL